MKKVIIGKKVGMTQAFDKSTGALTPVTVLDVSENVVSKVLKDSEGKPTHVEFGMGKKKNANKADLGNYKVLKHVPAHKFVIKIEGEVSEGTDEGKEIKADTFEAGDIIDVIGTSKGKGFAGVMKRWNFKGGKRTHGQSDRDRAPGSIGSGTTPGRVYKGKKMAGHMGNEQKTVKNLKVVDIDVDNNLISVSGSLPGFNGGYVVVRESFFNNKKN